MTDTSDLIKTPLFDEHIRLGARTGPFAGYAMPIQYTGIIAEHTATREGVTIFDICHMGEFDLSGPRAAEDLERLVSCNVASLAVGRCRYGLLCNEAGGVRDDLIIYRRAQDRFMIVVNAGTRAGDLAWIGAHLSADSVLVDISDRTAKLDIQGPASARVVDGLLDGTVAGMRYFGFREDTIEGAPVTVSRTGYTGELGFELYLPPERALTVWRLAVDAGALPAGLGARDTLRLEMGMPLYGHELSADRNAAESGFTWALSDVKAFVGSDAVSAAGRPSTRLAGLRIEGRRAARGGAQVVAPASGEVVGEVTSGSYGPSVGCAIALAYVASGSTGRGTPLALRTERAALACEVVDLPFYGGGTARIAAETIVNR